MAFFDLNSPLPNVDKDLLETELGDDLDGEDETFVDDGAPAEDGSFVFDAELDYGEESGTFIDEKEFDEGDRFAETGSSFNMKGVLDVLEDDDSNAWVVHKRPEVRSAPAPRHDFSSQPAPSLAPAVQNLFQVAQTSGPAPVMPPPGFQPPPGLAPPNPPKPVQATTPPAMLPLPQMMPGQLPPGMIPPGGRAVPGMPPMSPMPQNIQLPPLQMLLSPAELQRLASLPAPQQMAILQDLKMKYIASQQAMHMQAQAQARMYAQQQQQQQQQRPPRRIRWTEDKQYMTAQDVDYIVKMSEYQLQSDNPYIEDFYSLQYSLRSPQVKPTISKTALRVIREHRPIALVWRPANGTGRRGENPFQGALGRIPGHSIRAPRTLVELQKLSDEKAEEVANSGDEETARAMMAVTEGLTSLARTILLSIETCATIVLEIEDADALLSQPPTSPFHAQEQAQLRELRAELTQRLYEALHIQANPAAPPNFATHKDAFAIREDEFLIKMLTVPKGVRLLRRAVPLLWRVHVLQLLLALMRNLHIIVALAQTSPNKDDEQSLRNLFDLLLQTATQSLPHEQYLIIVQTLLAYHCTAPYFRRRLTNTFKTRVGAFVLRNLLKHGYEAALNHIQQLQHLPASDPQHQQVRQNLNSWKALVVTLMDHLAGNLAYLFTSSLGGDSSSLASTEELFSLLTAIALNASPQQKRDMASELAPLTEDIAANPPDEATAKQLELLNQILG